MARKSIESQVGRAMEAGQGVLRLAPTWVPRSFLVPGLRLKLHPADVYALGMDRGGIDERWFASTTSAANPGAPSDEGLSYIVFEGDRFLLRDAVAARGADLIGPALWKKYKRWPVYSKFFDNMGPIPHHMHLSHEQAALVKQDGKPESYYFPPQLNATGNNFPHTYFGLEPGVTRQDVRRCLERWNAGDNGILDLARAYRLTPGTGWFVPTRTLHAPGSLVTYEPQWGSDVFAMYQSLVEGRPVPWDLLVKDVPPAKHRDLDYLADMLDYEENCDPHFRANHWLNPVPVADTAKEGYVDRWVCYGRQGEPELFSAKELAVSPGVKIKVKDSGAYGLITTQGHGRIGKLALDAPNTIRFGEMTEDEVFVAHEAARAGVVFENTSPCEPLVVLRYFGPDTCPDAPRLAKVGA
jgi:hypothetical protein